MQISKYISLAFFALLSTAVLQAQDGLGSESVDVIKSFDAKLLETAKVSVNPELPPLDTSTKRQRYEVFSRNLDVDYLPPKIRPLAMRGDQLQKAYRGYGKVGGGLPSSVFADLSYNLVSEKKFDFGFNLDHHSANNNGQIENQRFSETGGTIGGTYYMEEGYAVNAQIGFNTNKLHFFGYNDLFGNNSDSTVVSFDENDVEQRLNVFDANISIFNGERTEADFNYYASADFYRMSDSYAVTENGFVVSLGAVKWFNEAHPLAVHLITDFTNYNDTSKQTLNNFYLQPSYTYHGDAFAAKIGANIASNNDEFSVFPDVELSAKVVEGSLSAFVGAGGTLQKNTFRSLTDYNPYLSSRNILENTSYYHYYGGIKGNIQGMDYRAQANYKTAENLALFVTDPTDTIPRFNVLYDTASIVSVQGSITAPLLKGLEITGTVVSSVYNLDNQEKAWHLPALSLNVGAQYTMMEEQLSLKAELFIENGVPFRNAAGEAENLNGLIDISVGAEYFFSENVGAFVQINNLANNRRQRWQHYPTFGMNALIGISALF